MKVIYIAGKYRGPNAWAIEQNIRAAEDVAARVWAAGHVALCPHANSRHMEGVATDEVFLAGTMELLRRCDAVLLVPNWSASDGARLEVAEADWLKIPVFGREPSSVMEEAITCMRLYFGADHGMPSKGYKMGGAEFAMRAAQIVGPDED